jgi:1,4-alpha-glucan branching enzyme
MRPWHDLVMHEMRIGTFNHTPGGKPGGLISAIACLPHLVELGINAVQVMPIGEFPGSVSLGENLSDPSAIETA